MEFIFYKIDRVNMSILNCLENLKQSLRHSLQNKNQFNCINFQTLFCLYAIKRKSTKQIRSEENKKKIKATYQTFDETYL